MYSVREAIIITFKLSYTHPKTEADATQKIKLTLFQKIILKLNGRVFTENRAKPGWRGPLPFYAFECDEHGLVEDYIHGYEGRLECPKCELSKKNAQRG